MPEIPRATYEELEAYVASLQKRLDDEQHAKELAELNDQIVKLNEGLNAANAREAELQKERDELSAKCESMEGHPDVIAAKNAAKIKAAENRLKSLRAEEAELVEILGDS